MIMEKSRPIELIQPDKGFGLRMMALTSTIRAVRVVAPADKNFVSIISRASIMTILSATSGPATRIPAW